MFLRIWDHVDAWYAFLNKIFKIEKKNEDFAAEVAAQMNG